MTLAHQATTTVPRPHGLFITCHVAVWYWAAQEAQSQGLIAVKDDVTTMGNIGGLAGAGQIAMMALPKVGTLNFGAMPLPPLPGPGAVLRWPSGATHVAVVIGPDDIAGYNQTGFMTNRYHGHGTYSIGRRSHVRQAHLVCDVLLGSTVINAAVVSNL